MASVFPWPEIPFETPSNTLADGQTLAQVDKPADRREDMEVETLGHTAVKLQAKNLLHTLGNR